MTDRRHPYHGRTAHGRFEPASDRHPGPQDPAGRERAGPSGHRGSGSQATPGGHGSHGGPGSPGGHGSHGGHGAQGGASGSGHGGRRRRRRQGWWRRGQRGHQGGAPANGAPVEAHPARPPGGPRVSDSHGHPHRRGESQAHAATEATDTGAILEARGILETLPDGGGFLRQPDRNYRSTRDDTYVPADLLRGLVTQDARGNGAGIEGIEIDGTARAAHGAGHAGGGHPHGGRPHPGGRHAGGSGAGPRLVAIRSINGLPPEQFRARRPFPELTSVAPFERIRLETDPQELSTRVIDILTPIGKGQRCLIVAPPRAGKTTLLQKIAAAITRNHPEIHLIVLLVDERPEEVTDMKRSVRGEVLASSADEMARQHVSLARIVLERSRRLVEVGKDVVILLDSLTRLARAHNTARPGTGRTLTGGLDARTLEEPRRLFGAARKAEEGGSLTVIATALVDTGSRMDDVIFQEFKGTGNMELVLDRALFEQRIYPSVDIPKSGTRKEEKLFAPEDLPRIHRLRRVLFEMKPKEAMQSLLGKLAKYPTNSAFLRAIDA